MLPSSPPTVKAIRKAEHVIRKSKGELRTNVLSEFNQLCQKRDLAAYRAVAAIQIVVGFFEAQDEIEEQIFTQGRGGPQIRPKSAEVECRGYSEGLQRAMTVGCR